MKIVTRRRAILLAPLLAAWCGGAFASTPCQQSVYAVDPATADTLGVDIIGEAWGQVVPVNDVLVQSVTFYTFPSMVGYSGSLWVTQVDATGKPLTHSIVYGGAAPVISAGDRVAPAHYDFVFDPPIALPAVGAYYFALKSDPCPGTTDVLAVRTPAHEGGAWHTARLCNFGLATLSIQPSDPTMNIAMRIVFCASEVTPAAKHSWGRVKSIYR